MNLLVLSFISTLKSVAITTLLARAVSQVIGSIGRDRRSVNRRFRRVPSRRSHILSRPLRGNELILSIPAAAPPRPALPPFFVIR